MLSQNVVSLIEILSDSTFVFMTDIHLQPGRQAVNGFEQAITEINRLNPRFVITGGDLIMDALGQNYGRADSLYTLYKETIRQFNMPVYNVMGNHEVFGLYTGSGIDPSHPEYGKKMFLNQLDYTRPYHSFDYEQWHFVLLDGIGLTEQRQYIGEIDDEQLKWLKEDLEAVGKDRPVVMAIHIPLFSVSAQFSYGSTAAASPGLVVTNSKDVWDICQPYNIKLVLQGHLHIVEEIVWRGTRFVTGGAVSGAWRSGPHQGFEEGFVVVDVRGNDLEWRYEDFGWEVK